MADKPKRKQKSTSSKKKKASGRSPAMIAAIAVVGVLLVAVISGIQVFLQSSEDIISVIVTEEPIPTLAIETLPPFERGLAYIEMGRFADAALALSTELEIAPDNLDALAARAHAHRLMGDLQLAVDDYSAVLSEEPERDGAWFGLAQAYYDLYRQTDEAIYLPDALEATRQAISASDGLDAETQAAYQRLLGDVAYDFEDFETATVAYRRYLDLTDVPSEQVTTRLETMP